jgi:eukaryotic-like serine/threonine-protein kinase
LDAWHPPKFWTHDPGHRLKVSQKRPFDVGREVLVQLVPGTVIAGRYHLVRPLSAGSMGTVWLARHAGLDVPCAVKFVHPAAALTEELAMRFEREAKAAAQLRSPNVVQMLDYGIWERTPYIAMEYLEGETLAERLSRVGKLPPEATVAILAQVARALGKAHARGLVHRDLKPANIFLVRDDDREIVKVLDFGVVKIPTAAKKTLLGTVLGTPSYMSPEQAKGLDQIDHRADLWSLAVVAFECITGTLPFSGPAVMDVMAKILVAPLVLPSDVASTPLAFDAWWERAASREPAHRHASARELVAALARAFELPLRSLLPQRSRSVAPRATPRTPPRAAPASRGAFVGGAVVLLAAFAFVLASIARGLTQDAPISERFGGDIPASAR